MIVPADGERTDPVQKDTYQEQDVHKGKNVRQNVGIAATESHEKMARTPLFYCIKIWIYFTFRRLSDF